MAVKTVDVHVTTALNVSRQFLGKVTKFSGYRLNSFEAIQLFHKRGFQKTLPGLNRSYKSRLRWYKILVM